MARRREEIDIQGNMEEHERVGLRQPPGIRCDLTLGLALPDTADILSRVGGEGALYWVNGGCVNY